MTMSRSLVPLALLFAASPIQAQLIAPDARTAALIANADKLVAVDADGCLENDDPDEIVVCARFDPNRKYRLPFPELTARTTRARVPIPNGNPEIIQQGRCYVTMDERNCFKGVPIMSVAFGGQGSGVKGPARQLWNIVEPPVPDEDYIKQVQIRAVPEN